MRKQGALRLCIVDCIEPLVDPVLSPQVKGVEKIVEQFEGRDVSLKDATNQATYYFGGRCRVTLLDSADLRVERNVWYVRETYMGVDSTPIKGMVGFAWIGDSKIFLGGVGNHLRGFQQGSLIENLVPGEKLLQSWFVEEVDRRQNKIGRIMARFFKPSARLKLDQRGRVILRDKDVTNELVFGNVFSDNDRPQDLSDVAEQPIQDKVDGHVLTTLIGRLMSSGWRMQWDADGNVHIISKSMFEERSSVERNVEDFVKQTVKNSVKYYTKLYNVSQVGSEAVTPVVRAKDLEVLLINLFKDAFSTIMNWANNHTHTHSHTGTAPATKVPDNTLGESTYKSMIDTASVTTIGGIESKTLNVD